MQLPSPYAGKTKFLVYPGRFVLCCTLIPPLSLLQHYPTTESPLTCSEGIKTTPELGLEVELQSLMS